MKAISLPMEDNNTYWEFEYSLADVMTFMPMHIVVTGQTEEEAAAAAMLTLCQDNQRAIACWAEKSQHPYVEVYRPGRDVTKYHKRDGQPGPWGYKHD